MTNQSKVVSRSANSRYICGQTQSGLFGNSTYVAIYFLRLKLSLASKKLIIAPSKGIPSSLDETEFITKKNRPSVMKKMTWYFFMWHREKITVVL